MFWKKKSEKPEGNRLFKVPEQSRGAFRVAPDPAEPVILKLAGADIHILDISSGGLSFKNAHYKIDTPYDVTLILPNSPAPIKTKLKIIRVTEAQICPAVFIDLSPEHEDEIHHYVLLRQKEELKSRKNMYT